jgi:hypothetical protein
MMIGSWLRRFWTADTCLVQLANTIRGQPWETAVSGELGWALREIERLKKVDVAFVQLLETIREIVTEPGDYLCWRDVFIRLGFIVGIEFDPLLLPPGQHLAQCACFVASLHSGKPYDPDALSREVKELRQRVAELERENAALAGAGKG